VIAEIVVADDIAAWTEQAVSDILALAADSIAERGRFVLCLAGGSTPSSVYDALATDRRSASIDWTAVALLLGDERCVPPDDPASNELMVRQRLLVPLGIDPSQLLRLRGERAPAERRGWLRQSSRPCSAACRRRDRPIGRSTSCC